MHFFRRSLDVFLKIISCHLNTHQNLSLICNGEALTLLWSRNCNYKYCAFQVHFSVIETAMANTEIKIGYLITELK